MKSQDQKKNIISMALWLTVITAVVKLISFLREIVISAYFGTSVQSDAYSFSFNLINMIFLLISTYLVTTYGPTFIKMKEEKNFEKSIKFTNNIITTVAIISTSITLIGIVFAPIIVQVIAPTYEGPLLDINIMVLRAMFLMLPFISIAAVYSSFLNAQNSYLAPQLVWLPGSLLIIFSCVILGSKHGINTVVIAAVLGSMLQILIQLPWSRKYFSYKLYLNLKDDNLKKSFKLAIPAFLGTFFGSISIVVDRFLISHLTVGSMSALDFATKLIALITSLLLVPITTILFTQITESISKKQFKSVNNLLNKSIQTVSFLLFPIVITSFLIPFDIVKIVYERGNFDADATNLTGEAFKYLIIGVLSQGIFNIIANFFYAIQKTIIPMICGSIGIGFNIITSIIFSKTMGIGGIALGTSFGYFIALLLIIFALKRETSYISFKSSVKQVLLIIISSSLSIVLVVNTLQVFSFEITLFKVIFYFLFVILVNFGVSFIIKIEVSLKLFKTVKNKLVKKFYSEN
ncbi:murein biosynthesis integral membrane protein MurJ [Psychrobacillus psychrotolerans]|uniref:murein biosynthesis integral membrane protein MurJ n=1 Tax=Psychrobacillus psychrotolerans TaxID=126156 RepID=UPI003315CA97